MNEWRVVWWLLPFYRPSFRRALERWMDWMRTRGSSRLVARPDGLLFERFFLLRLPRGRGALFLHRYFGADFEDLHCHPFHYATYVLAGGYLEELHDGTVHERVPGTFLVRHALALHRIEPLTEGAAWTLFAVGRHHRRWGYLSAEGPVRWDPVPRSNASSSELEGVLLPRLPAAPRERGYFDGWRHAPARR